MKLPQSLEKEIEQSAITYANEKTGTSLVYGYWPVHDAHKDGGAKFALAVLEKANKLAEALRFYASEETYAAAGELYRTDSQESWSVQDKAKNALAEWEEWKK